MVVDGEILGKPRDDDEAAAMLRRLSGRRHQVLTGVSLRQGAYESGRVETTPCVFRALTDEDIAWYVASGEGRDKAGGYAIQGLASRFIPRIDGSYSNVVGLPVACVDELLAGRAARRSIRTSYWLCSAERLVEAARRRLPATESTAGRTVAPPSFAVISVAVGERTIDEPGCVRRPRTSRPSRAPADR